MKITKTTHSKLANTDFDNLSFGKSFSDHMFIANFKDGQWTNEEIVPYGPISVNPSTHVFHYGQAIFEGMKAYKNKEGKILLFRPLDNLKRFNTSAEDCACQPLMMIYS
jgi:branched-chain amino acid aminotransferase